MGRVQLSLFALHIGIHAFFQLIRQVGKNVFFQSPQDKRSDHLLQSVHGSFILILNDRYFDFCTETLVAVQESGHEVVENTPELTQPVFNRRSGEGKTAF